MRLVPSRSRWDCLGSGTARRSHERARHHTEEIAKALASGAPVRDYYKIAIPADSIARAVAYAIEQPAEVDSNEIVIRPVAQEF